MSKRFGSVQALERVDVEFRAAEVHAILGENGAGKSTLMNIVYGLVPIDAGTVRLDGRAVRFRTPVDARRAGIGMVHQDFALVDAFSVLENLALTLGAPGGVVLRRQRVAAAATQLAAEAGLEIGELSARVDALPVGVRQRVELLKALAGEARILILDEPTAVLTPAETAQLFRVLHRLRDRGCAVLFITHKLREVMEIADRVTVLRRGRVVTTARRTEVTEHALAELMIGAVVPAPRRRTRPVVPDAGPLLRIDDLSVRGEGGQPGLAGIRMEVRAGEIFGIAGVDGNGQSELFEVLAGLRRPASGGVRIGADPVRTYEPGAMIAAGLGCIPPDRQRQGLILRLSILENAVLNSACLQRLARGPLLAPAATRAVARELVERYAIRAERLEAPAASLSGGNQQRLVVARALALEPRVLVALNPTRGLDIAAARAVYDAVDAALQRGTAVLLISTDLDEILELSDRMAVLYRGRLSEVLSPPFAARRVGLMMAGVG